MMPSVKREEESDRNSCSRVLTLDLSGRGIKKIEPLPEGMSPKTILYNNNKIFRIENLQFFEHLQQLSLADNHLVEMIGISQAQGLKVLDLSNNSIITIEGLTHLRSLEWLNLSGNSIKKIQNLEKNINLCHLDFSDNSIIQISNLRNLVKLKVLLLHGNLITSLKNVAENVAEAGIVTLSLSENEISDLNEFYYFRSFTSLEHLSIIGNPCLLAPSTSPYPFDSNDIVEYVSNSGFNYRPYILYNCPRLHNLDGQLISQIDRLEADRLRRDKTMRRFSPGRHSQLVTYLSQTTPLRPSTTRAPPTPNIDRVSSGAPSIPGEDQRWSVPVLQEKHSTEARDLALEDVSESESDVPLVSESCFVPVDPSLLPATNLDYRIIGLEDWFTTEVNRRSHHEKGSSLGVDGRGTAGVPVERDPKMEADGTGRQSQDTKDVGVIFEQNNETEAPLIMSEEEAFSLIHLAATIIQANVRGFLVRRKLNFYERRRKNQAATLIQATWKGYRTRTYDVKVIAVRNEIRARRLTAHINHLAEMVLRCQEQVAKDKRAMAKAIKCLWNELEKQNDMNVARLAREQNNAALRIQSSWKGYRARKMFPRSNNSKISYQSLAMICQDLQKQVNLMKSEIEELKSEKNRRESDVAQPRPHKLDRVKSTPEIRITRPSICILPERLQLDTGQPMKCEHRVEELLNEDNDLEIEPLDLGKYENTTQSVFSTTFNVEQEEVETNKDVALPGDSESKSTEDERGNEDFEGNLSKTGQYKGIQRAYKSKAETFQTPELREEIPNDVNSTKTIEQHEDESDESISLSKVSHDGSDVKNENYRGKDEQTREAHPENDDQVEKHDLKKDFSSEVEMTVNVAIDKDMSGFVSGHQDGKEKDELMANINGKNEDGEKEGKTSLFHKQEWIADSAKNNETLPLTTDENDTSSSRGTLSGASDTEVDSASPQAGQGNTDTSTSDTSPSPSKPEGAVARKKKKLLLRSSSAETMPNRIRALHSCNSLDSEQLSSSLNFSSRLGQRTAALLLELRSDIANLTARQFSDDYFDTQESVMTKGNMTEPYQTESKECETDTGSGVSSDSTAATIKNTTKPSKSPSDSAMTNIKTSEAKNLNSSDSGISCQELASNNPQTEVYSSDNNMLSVGVTPSRNDLQENVSETVRERDSAGILNDVGSRDEHGKNNTGISQAISRVVDKPSRPSSFTMPVFEDIERTSFSLNDFMEDSLDCGDE